MSRREGCGRRSAGAVLALLILLAGCGRGATEPQHQVASGAVDAGSAPPLIETTPGEDPPGGATTSSTNGSPTVAAPTTTTPTRPGGKMASTTTTVGPTPTSSTGPGYWIVTGDGSIYPQGNATDFGLARPGRPASTPIIWPGDVP